MNYQIIADSSCEMPQELRNAVKGVNVPLIVRIGDKELIDDENLDVLDMLSEIEQTKEKISSACPSPGAFEDAFEASDADYIFSITLSSRLSGSYNSALMGAKMAMEETGKKIHVFDSKSAAAGEVLVADKIRELADEGCSFEEIVEKVEEFIKSIKTYFVLDTPENLVKNGRIPFLLGKAITMLNIKLVLGSDGDGNIKQFSKAKGFNAAIKRMISVIGDFSTDTENRTLVISNCDNMETAEMVKKTAEEMYHFKNVIISDTQGLSSMYASRKGIIIAF